MLAVINIFNNTTPNTSTSICRTAVLTAAAAAPHGHSSFLKPHLPRKSRATMDKQSRWTRGRGMRRCRDAPTPFIIHVNGNDALVIPDAKMWWEHFRGLGDAPRPEALGLHLGTLLHRYFGQCLGCLDGKNWSRVRGAFNPLFSQRAAVARILCTRLSSGPSQLGSVICRGLPAPAHSPIMASCRSCLNPLF